MWYPEIRKAFAFLSFLACLILPSHSAFGAEENPAIHVTSDFVGNARVSIRPSAQGSFVKAAGQVPCDIRPLTEGNQEIRIEKPDGFFFVYRGEKKEVFAPENIMITTTREVLWERILLALVIPLAVAAELGRRARRRQSKTLEQSLHQAEIKTSEAQVRAERSSFEGALPETIAEYSIEGELGEGGMATVYRGRDMHGDLFAIKVPHRKLFNDRDLVKRFEHEVAISLSLKHRSIVRTFDCNLDDGQGIPYICFEYVEGRTLAKITADEAPLEPSRAIRYIREIAEALRHAHELSIVHRDLKPGNIMITFHDTVKVMDFGVAKAADLSRLTVTDTMLGTPLYMAPEQIDSKDADPRSDLYSLGMIFYELVTGHLPFEEDDPIKVIMKKHTHQPPPPGVFVPSLPRPVGEVIMKLIEREPSRRYQSAAALIDDLTARGLSPSDHI
ncbi:MAG: serine/threonine-protein kinase [Candidatus Eremiobacteraeota bacterium]|nr:serine/threonine-protein kinase [Candidatus Eremiobacteraeota bacterium]